LFDRPKGGHEIEASGMILDRREVGDGLTREGSMNFEILNGI